MKAFEIRNKLHKSLTYSFVDKYLGFSLRFITTIIIARLLTPHEVGIFSVAFVFISIGHVFRDFGVAQYLIREETVNAEKIRASLTVMWSIAWGLCFVMFVSKFFIAGLYQEPRLAQAIEVLALIFVIAPFGSVRIALLRREMNFKALALINIISYLTVNILSVYLALKGLGFMALVWGQFFGVIATFLGCLYFCRLKYWYWPGINGIKHVFQFGTPILFANIAEQTSDGAPDLIMGKLLDLASVGFYSRALGCINIFKTFVYSAVWPVVLPYYSELHRQGDTLTRNFLKGMQIYTVFAWPFFIGVGIFATPLVSLLYGEQWVQSVPLVKILCIMAIFEAAFPFRNALFVAIGDAKKNLQIQFSISLMRLFAVTAGAFINLQACVLSLCVAEFLGMLYQAYHIRIKLKILYKEMIIHLLPSVFISLFFALILLTYYKMAYFTSVIPTMVFALLVSLSAWGVAVLLFKHPLVKLLSRGRDASI